MRTKFVLFAVIPALLFFLLIYFFLDSWVEAGLEYAGEQAVGARVEIDNLSLTLMPVGARFDRLQVADPSDPWFNLFETGRVAFALDFGQLLRSKYIIETMEVNNVILGTKRSTDGSLPKEPVEEPDKSESPGLTEQAKAVLLPEDSKTPSFDLASLRQSLNIDSLLDPQNLSSLKHLDSLKRQVNEASVEWQRTLNEIDASKAKLNEIESSVKSINVGAIKDLPTAMNTLNAVNTTLKTANEVVGSFSERKKTLTESVNQFSTSIKAVDDLVQQDYQRAISLARLPDISMTGLAEMVLGKDVLSRAYTYLGYVEMVREKAPQFKSEPPLETPKRFEGQTIHFPVERSYPKYWVKKILLSGGTDQQRDANYFYASGEILNISNDQRITGAPITADIRAVQGRGTMLDLTASVDRRKAEPLDQYKATISGVPVKAMTLGRADFLPSKITNASLEGGVSVRVPGQGFDSRASIVLGNMVITFERDPKNTMERLVRDVFASITGFAIDLRMWKDANKFDVAFAPDLDDQLASRAKAILGAELTKIQNDIKAKINNQIMQKRQEVERLYAAKRDEVMAKVKQYEGMVNEKLAQVNGKKKELEDKIEAEKKKQTDTVKQKAGDALKKILK